MSTVLSVNELNKYIKEILSRDIILSGIYVKGEISNYKYHYSGHMYFTLKDEQSVIKCVMFKSQTTNLPFVPENGLKVIAFGQVSVFERDGQYQLYVNKMQPDGLGSLHLAYEQLKKKLENEGMFSNTIKKRIPFLPAAIGFVTSSTGSVIKDMINVISRRFPNVQIKLIPVAVQGTGAGVQIANAVNKFNELDNVDVIIVARGGGSIEELWAFNEEVVARSIFLSHIPVISAVGHETDFTICDFVADLRAPTPSAAAELVIPDRVNLQEKIQQLDKRLNNAILGKLGTLKSKLSKLDHSTVFTQPFDKINQNRMRIDALNKYIINALSSNFEKKRTTYGILLAKLDSLSPLTVLKRGYSVAVSIEKGNIIKSISEVKSGDKLQLNISDGKIMCTVDALGGDKNG